MLYLGVEYANTVHEPLVLTWSGLVLRPVTAWPLYDGHRTIRLPLFVIRFEGPWSIRVTRLLVLLQLSCLQGCFFRQGVLVGNG
jgi:hypothetical protein